MIVCDIIIQNLAINRLQEVSCMLSENLEDFDLSCRKKI